jgi:hypothetical protein
MNKLTYEVLQRALFDAAMHRVSPQDMLKMVTSTISDIRDISDLDAICIIKTWADSVYTALIADNLRF